MNWLIKLFQTGFAGIICFLFAIANRIIFTSLYSKIGTDTKIQLTYSENLLSGKGMGITKYFTNDLYNPIFDTHQMFPPGFSIAIIPFLKLTGGDEFKAVLVFDILVAVLFVIAVRVLGKKAGLPVHLINILVLIAGCSQYVFFMSWSSTDAIGLCLVMFCLADAIRIIEKKGEISRIFGSSVLLCLPFIFRYMYLPVAIIIPCFILFTGLIYKSRSLTRAGTRLLFMSGSLLLLLFIVNLSASGNALYVQNVGRGLFPGQLTHWYPFIPASFINLDFAVQLIQRVSGLDYPDIMQYFEMINLLLFILFLIFTWRYFKDRKKEAYPSNHFTFIVLGSLICVVVLLLLLYLSLTYKELPWGLTPAWTHVMDERYYAFMYIFFPLLLFVFYHYYPQKRKIVRLFAIVIGLCLLTEVLHGVYYNMKIARSHKGLAVFKEADKGYRNFPDILKQVKTQYPAHELIVCSPDQYYTCAASVMQHKAIFDYQNLAHANFNSAPKSILIVPVHSQEAIMMKEYIEKRNPLVYAMIAGTNFYIEEINPKQD